MRKLLVPADRTDSQCPWPRIGTAKVTFGITDVKSAVARISEWLTQCCSGHERPCQESSAMPLPRRMLKIDGRKRVRLYETNDACPIVARYACLSHYWSGL